MCLLLILNICMKAVNGNICHSTFSGELVKDMKSSDAEVQQKAMEEADRYIAALDEPCTTKVNKTTINTSPPLQPSVVKTCTQSHPRWKTTPSVVLHLFQTFSLCMSFSISVCYIKRVYLTFYICTMQTILYCFLPYPPLLCYKGHGIWICL